MQNMFISKGNLGKDPIRRVVESNDNGKEYIYASMSVRFDRYGVVDHSTGKTGIVGGFWRKVEISGHKGQACLKYLRKGARVVVIGTEREYMVTDKDTNSQVQLIQIDASDVALVLTRIETLTLEQSGNNKQAQEDESEEYNSGQQIAA